MPTTYNDQFYTFDPANPPGFNTPVSFVRFDFVDENDDGLIDANGDTVNGVAISASWPGDTVTIRVTGGGPPQTFTYTGITFYLANGDRVFTPTDGQILVNGRFRDSSFVDTQGPLVPGDLGPPCFTPGTRIRTISGDRLVEDLRPGDLVMTRDHGPQPLKWVGRRDVPGQGDFAPIRIAAGHLGNARDLLVSPQHRMVVSGWRAQLFYGETEVLVAAKHLVDDRAVCRAPCETVSYIHLMFAEHQIVFAEGAATESLDPHGDLARKDARIAREVLTLFPELDRPARPRADLPAVVRGGEGRALAL